MIPSPFGPGKPGSGPELIEINLICICNTIILMLNYGTTQDADVDKICILCNHYISPEYIYRYIYCLKCIKQCSNLFCRNQTKEDSVSCTNTSCNNYFPKNKDNYCYQCKRIEKIKLIQNSHNTISNTLPIEIIHMIFDFL